MHPMIWLGRPTSCSGRRRCDKLSFRYIFHVSNVQNPVDWRLYFVLPSNILGMITIYHNPLLGHPTIQCKGKTKVLEHCSYVSSSRSKIPGGSERGGFVYFMHVRLWAGMTAKNVLRHNSPNMMASCCWSKSACSVGHSWAVSKCFQCDLSILL